MANKQSSEYCNKNVQKLKGIRVHLYYPTQLYIQLIIRRTLTIYEKAMRYKLAYTYNYADFQSDCKSLILYFEI